MENERVSDWPPQIGIEPYYSDDRVVIFNADCRDVLPKLPKVDLLLTDPPYGIDLEEHGRNGYEWNVIGDESQDVGNHVLMWAEKHDVPTIAFSHPLHPWPGIWRQELVWDKGPAVGGGGDPLRLWKMCHETIQVARTGVLNGSRDSSVIKMWIGQGDYKFHPCQKPVQLMRLLAYKASQEGELLCDPFDGSCSTGVAAKADGRRCICIEVEQKYCEIGKQRCRQGVLL